MDDQVGSLLLLSTARFNTKAQGRFLTKFGQPLSQTLPLDILVMIFQLLSTDQSEKLYAPLICSHVCAHWRQAIINTPLLWSYIDVSRGNELTKMWLSRSGSVPLEVCLMWEDPMHFSNYCSFEYLKKHDKDDESEPEPEPEWDPIVRDILSHSHRWRSLDIAFSLIDSIFQALNLLEAPLENTLHLDSLTIGPMGRTSPVTNEEYKSCNKLRADCRILRIDAYCSSLILISTRLTVLEVFSGGWRGTDDELDHGEWVEILSQAPNLVHLKLTSFRYEFTDSESTMAPIHPSIELAALENLELSGAYVSLAPLFGRTSFPKLNSFLLNSQGAPNALAMHLADVLLESPTVQRLSLSVTNIDWLPAVLRRLEIQEITLFEMGWAGVSVALACLAGVPNYLHIYLERIWDIIELGLNDLKVDLHELHPIQLKQCYFKGENRCDSWCMGVCICDVGSTYSDNSSYSGSSRRWDSAQSEETGSGESERSYGEYDGPYEK